jgi:hypothetical protein
MKKKYSKDEVSTLKKAEIIELLNKENVEYDNTLSVNALRELLLNVEEFNENETLKGNDDNLEIQKEIDAMPFEERKEGNDNNDNNENKENKENKEEGNRGENKTPEAKEKKTEKTVSSVVFDNELARRLSAFGKKSKSAMDIELARRQGKLNNKLSFEEELKVRQLKARK